MAALADNLKNLGSGRLLFLIVMAAAAVSLIVVLALWVQQPDYQVLFSGLSEADSAAVVEKLKEKRIPYRVEHGIVTVPSSMVYEVRMELAGEGLPGSGSVGFEIFDETGFGVTEFVQKVNYRRALQGELARTISQINEIEAARVHLAIPDRGAFLDDEKRPRASVVIKLRPGRRITASQIRGIVHLVAGSIENLRAEDVTIVDTAGRMWTRSDNEAEGFGLTMAQLDYKRSLERDLETRVQSMLEKAVGMNRVAARVTVDVDTRRVEKTEERYDPDGQVVRSEQRTKEKAAGVTAAGGVPGAASNLPGAAAAAQPATNSTTQKQNEVVNYEINRVVSRVIEPMGEIRRLTVSVLVDGDYETVTDAEGNQTRKYVPRSEEELREFEALVKAAVGFSEERGDVISIVSSPFEASTAFAEADLAPLPPPSSNLLPMALKYGSVAAAVIFTVMFVLRPIVRRLSEESEALETIQRSLALPGGQGGQLSLGAGEGSAAGESRGGDDEMRQRIVDLVRQNPKQAAKVLRGWLKE
ncbi:MAG TPA: flagellar M-ring protein FliF [Deltaproteobacteria bacterium]|nr:flagellar M-ring protein FliF [Deltaproteobacteria bacterium]